MKYRKKPVVIDAVQWNGDNFDEIARDEFRITGPYYDNPLSPEGHLRIKTPEGVMRCNYLDWVITGIQGEVYPCKPSIFEATYELVEEQK